MNNPARLQKVQDDKNFSKIVLGKIEAWCSRHASFCLLICLIIFSILFVALMYALIGVSAVESGIQYNHIENII